jgi:hypothetical protein
MAEINQIFDRLGALTTSVENLHREQERARDRDEKIFGALEDMKVAHARSVNQNTTFLAQQAEMFRRLEDTEAGVRDYRQMKTRGAAIVFASTTFAGFLGYTIDHLKGWFKG